MHQIITYLHIQMVTKCDKCERKEIVLVKEPLSQYILNGSFFETTHVIFTLLILLVVIIPDAFSALSTQCKLLQTYKMNS